MKIDDNKYPILKMLKHGSLHGMSIDNKDSILINKSKHNIDNIFKTNVNAFKGRVRYVCTTLFDAIVFAKDKLLTLSNIVNIGDESGTILIGNLQYVYIIHSTPGEDNWDYFFMCLNKDLLSSIGQQQNGIQAHFSSHFLLNGKSDSIEERKKNSKSAFNDLLLILLFLKYADLEIKNLAPNRQIWDGARCVYNNKSNHGMEIIDSTWFTTLVKSDAFKVRGHFRLQPYGEGLSKKKLVWINEFQKEGYTRKAGIIKQNELCVG